MRAKGPGLGPSLTTSCLSTWAGDTKPDIVSKSSHRKLIKRRNDCVFFVLFSVSLCSDSINVYDPVLVYKFCSFDRMMSIGLLYKYPQQKPCFFYCIRSRKDIITRHNTDHVIAS